MNQKLKRYVPVVVRIGVGFVFFVFGLWQIINPSGWFGYVPNFILALGFNPLTILLLNGIFDTIVGLSLLSGLYLRVFAGLGVLHLLFTSITLGFNDVAVRDFGLMIVLIAVFLNGKDEFCLDRKFKKRN